MHELKLHSSDIYILDTMLYANLFYAKLYTVEKFTVGHVAAHGTTGWITVHLYMHMRSDPLNPNNNRGITLTSEVAKCLEIALLERLNLILSERGFPQLVSLHFWCHMSSTAFEVGILATEATVTIIILILHLSVCDVRL